MATAEINLSDSAIRKQLADLGITEVRDPKHPLKLRFNRARTGGSWHLVTYQNGAAKWRKVGEWPATGAKAMRDEVQRLTVAQRAGESTAVDSWGSCAGLLEWYRDRALADRALSAKRKLNIKSSINKHLIPMLGNVAIEGVDRKVLDELLLWPLQARYGLGTVRQHYAVLKKAFKQAAVLRRIKQDPLAGIKFSDFTDASIKTKGSGLEPGQLAEVLSAIAGANNGTSVLLGLMLALGTRIGETRRLKWAYIDMPGRRLTIPAQITKTGVKHVLPLSDWLVDVLTWYRGTLSGKWLFPVSGSRGCIDDRNASRMVRSVSLGEWTAHDLRKLARTCWADLGVDYMVAEQLLNHSMTKLDQAYIHTYMENQKRSAIELWHGHLVGIKNPFKTKIIPRYTSNGDSVNAA
ncbi:tyrosine-type recombinase/integrase [Shewanella sp. KCT]|uniref:tyrosine-type recombinase/integrase n=1 Tax=Shewanella sp. KCT TaxID=2569535 RepID=UPI001183CAEA|nr:site-specific integrase [Shewanella sp. KCT]TVP11782.1 recombinase [Shewanella sp. KCT]